LLICVLAMLAVLQRVVADTKVEQIALNYDASTSKMEVTFAAWTDETNAQIKWGDNPHKLTNTLSVTGSKYNLNNYTSPMLFRGTMDNLKEGNKLYYYSVGSDALGYSNVAPFRSHPGVGVEDVTFHIFGDLGQTENSQNTLKELSSFEAKLKTLSGGIVSMGDLSYANGDEPQWDSFGEMKQSTSNHIPMMTTLGNHEWFDSNNNDFTAYLARYDNPMVNGKRELYYSYDAGLVHWVMVAGYCPEMKTIYSQPCLAEGSPQMNWLKQDLASVDRTKTPWVVVVFHEPYMNSNTAHSMSTEGKPIQQAIEQTLYDNKVDLVFSGHVHAYERTCQAYHYNCEAGAPYYVTIGDGGNAEGLAATWVEPQPAWSMYRQASYGFGELRVMNSTHATWKWHQNQDLLPEIADSFTFTRGSAVNTHNLQAERPVTGKPMFTSDARGEKAQKFNEKMSALYRKQQQQQQTEEKK